MRRDQTLIKAGSVSQSVGKECVNFCFDEVESDVDFIRCEADTIMSICADVYMDATAIPHDVPGVHL